MLRKRVEELEKQIKQLSCKHSTNSYEIFRFTADTIVIESKCGLCEKGCKKFVGINEKTKKALKELGIKL